jgi:RNA polymerase sigma factor (TIGR02999 family)
VSLCPFCFIYLSKAVSQILSTKGEITHLLMGLSAGDTRAEDQIITFLYKDLRRLAKHYLANERRDHTLQATALVHEAYIRITGRTGITWQNRRHFFATAAREMRRVLIDHARHVGKRPRVKVSLDESALICAEQPAELLVIDEALDRLAKWDSRQAQVVEMRFFAGLSLKQIATALDVCDRTVKRDWEMARAWLYGELTKSAPSESPLIEADRIKPLSGFEMSAHSNTQEPS